MAERIYKPHLRQGKTIHTDLNNWCTDSVARPDWGIGSNTIGESACVWVDKLPANGVLEPNGSGRKGSHVSLSWLLTGQLCRGRRQQEDHKSGLMPCQVTHPRELLVPKKKLHFPHTSLCAWKHLNVPSQLGLGGESKLPRRGGIKGWKGSWSDNQSDSRQATLFDVFSCLSVSQVPPKFPQNVKKM